MPTNTRWQCVDCKDVKMTTPAPGRLVCPRCGGRSWLLVKDKENLGLTYDGRRKVFTTPKAVIEQNIPGSSTGYAAEKMTMNISAPCSIVIGVMQGNVVLGNHSPKVRKMLKQRPKAHQWIGKFAQYVGNEAIGRIKPTSKYTGEYDVEFKMKISGEIGDKAFKWRCIGCANVMMTPMPQSLLFCHCCGGATWFRLDDKALPRGGKIYGKHTNELIAPKTPTKGTIVGKVEYITPRCNVLNIQGSCSVVIGTMQGDVVVSGS